MKLNRMGVENKCIYYCSSGSSATDIRRSAMKSETCNVDNYRPKFSNASRVKGYCGRSAFGGVVLANNPRTCGIQRKFVLEPRCNVGYNLVGELEVSNDRRE